MNKQKENLILFCINAFYFESAKDAKRGKNLLKLYAQTYNIPIPTKTRKKQLTTPEKMTALTEFIRNEKGYIKTLIPLYEALIN